MVKISSLGYHLLGKIPDDTPLRKVVPTRMEVLPWVVERDEEGDLLKRRLPSFEELEELAAQMPRDPVLEAKRIEEARRQVLMFLENKIYDAITELEIDVVHLKLRLGRDKNPERFERLASQGPGVAETEIAEYVSSRTVRLAGFDLLTQPLFYQALHTVVNEIDVPETVGYTDVLTPDIQRRPNPRSAYRQWQGRNYAGLLKRLRQNGRALRKDGISAVLNDPTTRAEVGGPLLAKLWDTLSAHRGDRYRPRGSTEINDTTVESEVNRICLSMEIARKYGLALSELGSLPGYR